MKRVIERQTKNERVAKGERNTHTENDIYITYIERERERETERE